MMIWQKRKKIVQESNFHADLQVINSRVRYRKATHEVIRWVPASNLITLAKKLLAHFQSLFCSSNVAATYIIMSNL